MNFKKLNERIKRIPIKLQKRLMVSSLLVLVCVLTMSSVTLMWQAYNQEVKANNLVAKTQTIRPEISYRYVYDTNPITYSDWEVLDGNDTLTLHAFLRRPGIKVVVELRVENTGAQKFYVDSFGLYAPEDSMETPKVVNAVNYYLGTQLQAYLTKIGNAEVTRSAEYLASISGETITTEPVVLFCSSNSIDENGNNAGGTDTRIAVDAGESVYFTFEVLFENKNESQDMYKHFGEALDAAEHCSRCLFVECNP